MAAPGFTAGRQPQFPAQRFHEDIEQFQKIATTGLDDLPYLFIEHGAEDDWPGAIPVRRLLNDFQQGPGTLFRVDEGHVDPFEVHALELGEQTVAHGLGGDAGAFGDEEDGAFHDATRGYGG